MIGFLVPLLYIVGIYFWENWNVSDELIMNSFMHQCVKTIEVRCHVILMPNKKLCVGEWTCAQLLMS